MGQHEYLSYDSHNRLTDWNNGSITYNSTTGNINTKSNLGAYTLNYGEDNTGPHALTSITGVAANFPTNNLEVTYTDFKKIKTLTEGNKHYQITYGIDDQRKKSVYKENNVNKETRYYIGDYEEKTDHTSGITEKIHYLSGAIYIERSNGTHDFYYAYTDYQGSLIALTDESGNVVERYAYDPWGKRRNPDDWEQPDSRTSWLVNRGYTGHEHLDQFGIINMNGRVYDPLTASFFSPDPYIQAPDNWLNYNRYAYAYGNPFKYTDPDGEWVHLVVGAVAGGLINWLSNGAAFTWEGLSYLGAGAAAGLITAAAPGAYVYVSAGLSATNNFVQQSFDPNIGIQNVNYGQVLFQGMMGGVTSYVGSEFGKALQVDKWFKGIDSPLLKNWLTSTTTNTIVGGAFGGVSALANGQHVGAGVWGGMKMGAITGTISGIAGAVNYSHENNVNILTGKPINNTQNNTVTLYRAVSLEELADIHQNGIRVNPDGTGYQHEKLFYNSYEDALKNTQAYDAAYGQKSIIIEIQGPKNLPIYNNGYMDGFVVTRINSENLHLLRFNLRLK